MFRATKDNPFKGPHQQSYTARAGVDMKEADAAMIMVHGRGASAESILTLADEFDNGKIHYAAPQASGSTWYPYSFLAPTDQNEPGLSSGLQAIFDLVSELEENGIPKEKILILGFSQGACLASEFAARHPVKYAGVIALTGGLIGDSVSADNYSGSLEGTPYFVGSSDVDPHIPEQRVHDSAEIMEGLGATITKKLYTGMGHTVNMDEIDHIKKLLQ